MLRLSLLTLLAACLGAADVPADADLPKHQVLAAPPISSYETYSTKEDGGTATIEGDVLHLVNPKHHGKNYAVSGSAQVEVPAVPKSAPLLLRLEARAVSAKTESGKGEIWVFVPGCYYRLGVKVSEEWQALDIPYHPIKAIQAGKGRIKIDAGACEQDVLVRKVRILRFPDGTRLADLPRIPNDYPGREPDAAWRKAAAERIEKIRKGDLRVEVFDAEGGPVPGASVSVKMQRHRFGFGSLARPDIVNPGAKAGRELESELERAAMLRHFNTGISLNYWDMVERGGFEGPYKSALWCRGQGMDVRAHVLLWGKRLPQLADHYFKNDDEVSFRRIMRENILHMTRTYRGIVRDWDVVNEPFYSSSRLTKKWGMEIVADAFRAAHEGDPDARLFMNEFGILSVPNEKTEQKQTFEDWLTWFKEHDVPIGGIGLQAHFSGEATPPETMLRILDRYAKFELPIVLSEYDYVTPFEDDEADFLRDILYVSFSHPAVDGFMMWGHKDDRHWRGQGPLYRKDWSLKPSGKVYQELVHKTWWTDTSGTTAEDGGFAVRGFQGHYLVTVKAKGFKAQTRRLELGPEGCVLVVTARK